jgi:hypothetical protein
VHLLSQAAAAIYRVDLEPPEIEISQDHTRIAADLEQLKSGAASHSNERREEFAMRVLGCLDGTNVEGLVKATEMLSANSMGQVTHTVSDTA